MHKYKDIGFALTPQRIAILEYLDGNKGHPSADEIYKAILGTLPTMSLATVYTTLAALNKRGKLRMLTIDPEKRRYDPDIADHSHMICISCKRIIDLDGDAHYALPEALVKDFSVLTCSIELTGLCPNCKQQERASTEEDQYVR